MFVKLCLAFVLFLATTVSCQFCTSSACRKASSDILSFIDASVDPCEDFYKFTCGGLFKKTFETKPASLYAIISKEVEEQTSSMLQKHIEHLEPKALQALKMFYRSCMNEVAIEQEGVDTVKQVLIELGGWPVIEGLNWDEDSFNIENLLIKLRRLGYDYMQLFYFGTTVGDDADCLLIGEPITKNIEEDEKERYQKFMVGVAVLLGADKEMALSELQDVLAFKLNLLRLTENAGQLNKTSIQNVQVEYPMINWLYFINNIVNANKEFSQDQELYFPSVEYLNGLAELLKNVSNRTLSNFIIWQAIEAAIPYLPNEFRSLKEKYSPTPSDGVNKEEATSRLTFCKMEAKKILPPTFELLYIREYFSLERRKHVQELISFIHTELLNILNVTELYDEETRDAMLEKAKVITYHFGAPQRMFDKNLVFQLFNESENIDTSNFLTLASILNRQRNNFRLQLDSEVNRYDSYYEETVLVNAFYETFRNAFVLPAAILQGLYFNEKRPQYMNFGTIGTIAGIELMHGFTYSGSKYDKSGNLARLWSNVTKRNYNRNADCLIRQANNYEIEDLTLRMDGRQTLEKNICDYTGVEIAYRAYNMWTEIYGKEDLLPGLDYTPKQLFWISTASTFCDTISLDNLKEYVDNENHALPRYRTIASLSNNKNFGDDFNCPIGSTMNPISKCQVF